MIYSLLRKKKIFYDAANYRFDDYSKLLSEVVELMKDDAAEAPKPLTEDQVGA